MDTTIFADNGPLVQALKEAGKKGSIRGPQKEYAEAVAAAIQGHKPLFADAETGVGKTLGYLIPTACEAFKDRSKKPIIVVSTATIVLQRQLLEDDIPIMQNTVKKVLGYEPKAEFRIGREQVIDIERLEDAIQTLADTEDKELAEDIIKWVDGKIRDECLPLRADLMMAFADQIPTNKSWLSSPVIGLQPDSSGQSAELYRQLLERCDNADILVVNHHLLALHMLRPFLWDIERPAYIVVDEADRLPSTIEQLSRKSVPLHLLSSLLKPFDGTEKALDAVEQFSLECSNNMNDAWLGSNGAVKTMSQLHDDEKSRIIMKLKTAEHQVDQALVALKSKSAKFSAEQRESIAQIERYCDEMASLNAELGSQWSRAVIYYSPIRQYPGIASVNAGSGKMIASRLWLNPPFDVKGLIFTSATLSTMASRSSNEDAKRAMTPFISDCGFKIGDVDQTSCLLIAPTKFGEMTFMRPYLGAPAAFKGDYDELTGAVLNDDAIAYWLKMIQSAHEMGGRTLVLVPSFRDINRISQALDGFEGNLVAQTAGMPTNAAIVQFLSNENSVWISASAWEGVSLPGAISHIVIPRLPIRPSLIEDDLIEKYFEEIGKAAKGKSYVFGRKMAATRRRLRQGIGRGIRSDNDNVRIWIGDPRWPLSQTELDEDFRDQPTTWSSTMLNAIPKRFRKKLEKSERFAS